MESRESKFREYRESIKKLHEEAEIPQEIEEEVVETKHSNTLTMTIDQIIEAHDEYTAAIKRQELEENQRRIRIEERKDKTKTFLKYFLICAALIVFVLFITIILVIFLG